MDRSLLNGHPANISPRLVPVIIRARRRHGLVVTATTDGNHAPLSWHKPLAGRNRLGRAVDFGFSQKDLARLPEAERQHRLLAFQHEEFARAQRKGLRPYKEVIGPCNLHAVLDGKRTWLPEGSGLENAHDNHVHIAR